MVRAMLRASPVVNRGKSATDLPRRQREHERHGQAHKRVRGGKAFENVEQHQSAADDNQEIWLHVKARLNADKQRLKVQISEIIEHDDVKEPSRAKETGKIRLDESFRRAGGGSACLGGSAGDDAVQVEGIQCPGEDGNERRVSKGVFDVEGDLHACG